MSRPVPSGLAVDVWWFDTRADEPGPAELAALSEEEQARAARLVFAADRHRYRAAHALLRRVLAGYLGAQPGDLRFGRQPCPRCGGPDGRPVLAPAAAVAAPLPWFSLSHSGDAVVIAIAGRPVGVDAEQEPAGCVCSLAGTMHPADAAAVAGLTERERHAAVIRWWVRAEAVLKCAGEGIAHRLGAFPVLPGAGLPGAGLPGGALPGGALPGGALPGGALPGGALPGAPPAAALPADAGSGSPAAGPSCSLGHVPAPPGYQAAVALAGQDGPPAVALATPPGQDLA